MSAVTSGVVLVVCAFGLTACGDDGGDIDLARRTPSTDTSDATTTSDPGDLDAGTTEASPTTELDDDSNDDLSPTTVDDSSTVTADEVAEASDWTLTAAAYNGRDGLVVRFDCPPDGTLSTVWGTEVYTDDSSVCSAATHAGLITTASGGSVFIRIMPGREAYVGSEANGVTTLDYGSWGGSYSFLGG